MKTENGISTVNEALEIVFEPAVEGGDICILKNQLSEHNLTLIDDCPVEYTDVQAVQYLHLKRNTAECQTNYYTMNPLNGNYDLDHSTTYAKTIGSSYTPEVTSIANYTSPVQQTITVSSDETENIVNYYYKLINISFRIIDATTGNDLDGTNLTLSINDSPVTYTISSNRYVISYPGDNFSISVTKTGYNNYNVVSTTPTNLINSGVALTPIGKYSAYANWNKSAISDIDTHFIIYDENMNRVNPSAGVTEVSYGYKGEYNINNDFKVKLDIDDTGGSNGETISIEVLNNENYAKYTFYYVLYRWSPSSGYMNNFGITVTVGGQTITPPAGNDPGVYYRVFSMKNNVVTVENTISEQNAGYWELKQDMR